MSYPARITPLVAGLLELYPPDLVWRWASGKRISATTYRVALERAGVPSRPRGRPPGRGQSRATPEVLAAGRAMHAQGYSRSEISRTLGGSIGAWYHRLRA